MTIGVALGLIMLVSMIGAIFIGFPVSFTLLFLALLFGGLGLGWEQTFNLAYLQIWGTMKDEIFPAVPLFIPSEQQKWLAAEVAAGRFGSVEDAIAAAVAELTAADRDDLAWARPYVEAARASVASGDVISGTEFFERLERKLDKLRSS